MELSNGKRCLVFVSLSSTFTFGSQARCQLESLWSAVVNCRGQMYLNAVTVGSPEDASGSLEESRGLCSFWKRQDTVSAGAESYYNLVSEPWKDRTVC